MIIYYDKLVLESINNNTGKSSCNFIEKRDIPLWIMEEKWKTSKLNSLEKSHNDSSHLNESKIKNDLMKLLDESRAKDGSLVNNSVHNKDNTNSFNKSLNKTQVIENKNNSKQDSILLNQTQTETTSKNNAMDYTNTVNEQIAEWNDNFMKNQNLFISQSESSVSEGINNNAKNKDKSQKDGVQGGGNKKPSSKYCKMTLNELASQWVPIAKKQTGCRYLQKIITNQNNHSSATYTNDIINLTFYPALPPNKLLELCHDLFGNYLIQKMIPHLTDENWQSLTDILLANLESWCLDPHGTRVIQVYIGRMITKEELLNIFTHSLIPLLPKLINDLNGSFVLISFAKIAQSPKNDFIFTFLNNYLMKIASLPYGCSAWQKLLDVATEQQKHTCFTTITKNSLYLITDQYGNYVIQYIIMKNIPVYNDQIALGFLENFIFWAKQKFSSNVIEKCFDFCSPKIKGSIVTKIMNKENIMELLRDMYGNYVWQKIVNYGGPSAREFFIEVVGKEINNWYIWPFGQKLITKLMLSYPELRQYVDINLNRISGWTQQMNWMNVNNQGNNNNNYYGNNAQKYPGNSNMNYGNKMPQCYGVLPMKINVNNYNMNINPNEGYYNNQVGQNRNNTMMFNQQDQKAWNQGKGAPESGVINNKINSINYPNAMYGNK